MPEPIEPEEPEPVPPEEEPEPLVPVLLPLVPVVLRPVVDVPVRALWCFFFLWCCVEVAVPDVSVDEPVPRFIVDPEDPVVPLPVAPADPVLLPVVSLEPVAEPEDPDPIDPEEPDPVPLVAAPEPVPPVLEDEPLGPVLDDEPLGLVLLLVDDLSLELPVLDDEPLEPEPVLPVVPPLDCA